MGTAVDLQFDRIVAGRHVTVRHLAAPELAFGPHVHAAYTVASVLAGSLSGAIGEHAVTLRAGDSALSDPGQVHEARATGCELVSVAIDPTLIDKLLTELGWYQEGAHPTFRGPVVTDPAIVHLMASLAGELAGGLPGQQVMLDALVRQLGVHLLRTHLRVRRAPTLELSRAGPVDRRLRRAIELMHARCGEELSLKELAASVFLSEYYFVRLFKEVTGLTPHAYLANLRIERARALLLQTDLPITRIAADVGYRSPSHFAHAFRSSTGVSPRAFRAAAHRIPARHPKDGN
jgi:AraC family transcriptional regulator